MSNSIELEIEPVDYCLINKYDPTASLCCIVKIYLEAVGNEWYCWGANKESLLKLISVLESFFEGKISEDFELMLFASWHMGNKIFYPSSFYIDSAEKTWTYRFKMDERSREFDLVYKLTDEQLYSLYEQLRAQFLLLDWDLIGKAELYTFDLPEREFEWCYSAEGLKKEVEALVKGRSVKAIYVSAGNYINPLSKRRNFVNYYSGEVMLRLDDLFIDFYIYASGLFRMRVFKSEEATVNGPRLDYIRDSRREMCDIRNAYGLFELEYRNSGIKSVEVESVDYTTLPVCDFDDSKLGNPVELPKYISLTLNNGSVLTLGGLDDDFIIRISEL